MSIEAMKQALEALERGRSQIIGALVQQDQDKAITALRQAIAEAEKQEPVAWQPIATAPTDTEVFIGAYIDGEWKFGRSELFYEQANEFAGETFSGWFWAVDGCDNSVAEEPTHWMPLPEPPHTAPVAQCTNSDSWNCKYCRKTETCEALKDSRNFGEPVHASDISQERVDETAKCGHDWVEMQCPCGHKMYVKHTGREWVGLTDEEVKKIVDLNTEDDYGYDIWCNGRAVARDVEAKLKEKNT